MKRAQALARENRQIRDSLCKITALLIDAADLTRSLVQPPTPTQLRIQTSKIRSARTKLAKLHNEILNGKGRQ
jgi:hypothetical protein